MAMRLASHDPETHRKRAPADPEARAAFDALEQARVRGTGLRPHARHGRQYPRDAGGPAVPRQLRRGRRPRRCADRRGPRPDAARADRGRDRAALGQRHRRSLEEGDRSQGGDVADRAAHAASRIRTCSRAPQSCCCATSTSCPTATSTTAKPTTSEDGDDQDPDKGEDSDKTPEQGEGENEDSEADQDETPGSSDETGDVEGAEADMAETDEDASPTPARMRRSHRRPAPATSG